MAEREWLLVVFFDYSDDVPMPPIADFDDEEQCTHWLGLPLWIPSSSTRQWEEDWAKKGSARKLARHKGAVCRWAIDYAATSDDRWVVFGTFGSRKEATDAYLKLLADGHDIVGYRVLTEWALMASSSSSARCIRMADLET